MAGYLEHHDVLRWFVLAAFVLAAGVTTARLARPARDGDATADAAHLLMCPVMVVMLVFPAGADPLAMRGVLTAAAVVFAALAAERILRWRTGTGRREDAAALGYHTVAAGAMLYAMSGHGGAGHAGPPAEIAVALAVLFAADAALALLPVRPGRRAHLFAHAPGAHLLTSASVPHVVMDLGTAFMLLAVAAR
ncbi:DUF5134 domain-containing protein [Nocardia thailandica]|uniref:DUF5134 domain-containing protein n=1 Tax=Nocardia thailandica TaxID=257275 RepID=A0ABW6PQM0_9NOCA